MTELRFYVWEDGRWHDAKTGAIVEWHEWGEYRFSFDIGPDLSRFIVVRPRQLRMPNGEIVDGPKQLAAGLIQPPLSRDGAPRVLFDAKPTEELPHLLPLIIGDRWLEMCQRLKQSLPGNQR